MKTIVYFFILFLFSISTLWANINPSKLSFVENKGQILPLLGEKEESLLYQLQSEQFNISFYQHKITYTWKESSIEGNWSTYQTNMQFTDIHLPLEVVGQSPLPNVLNYYLPHCKEGIHQVKNYQKIVYQDTKGNTQLGISLENNAVIFDFYPQASDVTYKGDVKQFQKHFKRQNTQQYILDIQTKKSVTDAQCQQKPTLFPEMTLEWGTYLGGTSNEALRSVALDNQGNVYVLGGSKSANNIASNGMDMSLAGDNDIVLAKFSNDGVLQWATYYGGSGNDYGVQLVVSSSGDVFISARTLSSGLSTSGVHQEVNRGGPPWGDALLAKFTNDGVLVWATYFGGDNSETGAVGLDHHDNIYLMGQSRSTSGVATPGAHQVSNNGGEGDLFLARFNNDGTLDWATYYGGSGYEDGKQITFDSQDNIYVSGFTQSSSGIATSGADQEIYGDRNSFDSNTNDWGDGFLVKFDSDGVRLWATYFGGAGNEAFTSVVTDQNDNVYVTGGTTSVSQIATPSAHQTSFGGDRDAILVKYNTNGEKQWATYYGGSGFDLGWEVITDEANNVYVAGLSGSTNNITTNDVYQSINRGGNDAVIVKFDENGVRQWATYYGGSGNETAFGMVKRANVDEIFIVGGTRSSTHIDNSDAVVHQSSIGGNLDAFLAKFTPPLIALNSSRVEFSANLIDEFEALLNWDISNQLTIESIELQKSTNGAAFETIGYSEKHKAQFLDDQCTSSSYYRLKIWQNQNNYILSNVTFVEIGDKLHIYPNPVIDQIYIGFEESQIKGKIERVLIFNAVGEVVLQIDNKKPLEIESILNQQLKYLSSGVYMIQFWLDKSLYTHKIVKGG